MSANAVYLQPAFILQHKPFRESSLLLEVFTRDFGIISVLAKGVRREKSKLAGLLLPFSLLNISYLDKNELKILTQAEYVESYALQRLALYCGFYVNELLQRFLHRNDPHPGLFLCYQICLQNLLDNSAVEQSLRYFELDLLDEAGYGASLEPENAGDTALKSRQRYNFLPDVGMVEDAAGLVSETTLRLLAAKASLEGESLAEAKLLLRKMLDVHLLGRPLKSRDVLAKIIKYL
jgi:DNA repair protein RecO (recombination protein O)